MSTWKQFEEHKPDIKHAEVAKDGSTRPIQLDASAGFDKETEDRLTKSLLRKLDTRMLPMLAILFLFSFLDRTNIGNAKVSSLFRASQTRPADFAALTCLDPRTAYRSEDGFSPVLVLSRHLFRILYRLGSPLQPNYQESVPKNLARRAHYHLGRHWYGHGLCAELYGAADRASFPRGCRRGPASRNRPLSFDDVPSTGDWNSLGSYLFGCQSVWRLRGIVGCVSCQA
jgi:hypothetical protein